MWHSNYCLRNLSIIFKPNKSKVVLTQLAFLKSEISRVQFVKKVIGIYGCTWVELGTRSYTTHTRISTYDIGWTGDVCPLKSRRHWSCREPTHQQKITCCGTNCYCGCWSHWLWGPCISTPAPWTTRLASFRTGCQAQPVTKPTPAWVWTVEAVLPTTASMLPTWYY